MDERSTGKRRRTLDAAQHLFLRDGIRATTMEAIAKEAGIAKQTLYSQFPDKPAVLEAVIETIVDTLCRAVDLGLDGDVPVAERVGRALAGKFVAIHRLVGVSPHADEMFSEHARLAHKFRAADEATERAIADELGAAGAPDATRLAKQLVAASYGIGRKLAGEDEVSAAILSLCMAMIEANLPSGRRALPKGA